MQQPTGVMQVHAVIADDGRRVIILEWPNGDQLMFDRDEAIKTGLSMVSTASRLFGSVQEFERHFADARSAIFNIHYEGEQRPQ